MEKKKKNLVEPVHLNNRRSANPSFSSTLLESIYRSIDEKAGIEKPVEEIIMPTSFYHSMKKKHNNFSNNEAAAVVLSNSNSNSSSSSNSESSFWSGGLSSSSDSESAHYYYYGSKSSSSSMQRPKPIRTERSSSYGPSKNNQHEQQEKAAKIMSKAALKIYNQLKKVKNKQQPISPGAKLSSFLNSLFTHPKKKNKPTDPSIISSNSNCSSSYTRSCLTKTPKLSHNGSKRSVRFFPVSVIVDQDSQPCGHKKLIHQQEEEDDELRVVRVMEENRKVAEAAKKLTLESYRKPKKESYGGTNDYDDSEDEDDDDGMSCASSDLFELNNLSGIGIGRYSEELPVYETTHVHTNRAIANGLIV